MDSQQSSDPFVRNRHRWATGLWVVGVLTNGEALTNGWRGSVAFLGTALIYGVVAYMVGSHKDRDRASFWRPLLAVWGVTLVAIVGWTVFLSVSDGEIAWRGTGSLIFAGLMLALVTVAHRRTSAGKPWRPTPEEARASN